MKSIEARKTADSTFDRIYKFYFNKKSTPQLTPEEDNIRQRWDFAWKLMCEVNTRRQVADSIQGKFDVSRSIAYDDIANAMMLFPDAKKINREAKRALAEEWILWALKTAKTNGDVETVDKLVKRYMELNGLDGDSAVDPLKDYAPVNVFLVADPKELERQISRIKERVIDISHEEAES